MEHAIVLASASPRRRALLGEAGLAFEVRPVDVDEDLEPYGDPLEAAERLAERKARACAEELLGTAPTRRRWVVGADTVVAVPRGGGPGWELLGKPADPAEARAMLAGLGGTRHVVATGVAVVELPALRVRAEVEATHVTMRPLDAREVEAYVATGEWRDKAGGYAIQETADAFVERLEGGGFDNVVGLPVALTLALLRAAGAPGLPAPSGGDPRAGGIAPGTEKPRPG